MAEPPARVPLNLHLPGSQRIRPLNTVGMNFQMRQKYIGAESNTPVTSKSTIGAESNVTTTSKSETPKFYYKKGSLLDEILNKTPSSNQTEPTYRDMSKEQTDRLFGPRREDLDLDTIEPADCEPSTSETREKSQDKVQKPKLSWQEKQARRFALATYHLYLDSDSDSTDSEKLKKSKSKSSYRDNTKLSSEKKSDNQIRDDLKDNIPQTIGKFLDFMVHTAETDPEAFAKMQCYQDWKVLQQTQEAGKRIKPKLLSKQRMLGFGSVPFIVSIYEGNEIKFEFDPYNAEEVPLTFSYEDIARETPLTMLKRINEILEVARCHNLNFKNARFLVDNDLVEQAIALTQKININMDIACASLRYEIHFERDIEKLSKRLNLTFQETINLLEIKLAIRVKDYSNCYGGSLIEAVEKTRNNPFYDVSPCTTDTFMYYHIGLYDFPRRKQH